MLYFFKLIEKNNYRNGTQQSSMKPQIIHFPFIYPSLITYRKSSIKPLGRLFNFRPREGAFIRQGN